jgi:hypothetical protein
LLFVISEVPAFFPDSLRQWLMKIPGLAR